MFRALFDSFFSGNDYKNFVFQISERRFVNKYVYSCGMNVLSLNSYSFGNLYSKYSLYNSLFPLRVTTGKKIETKTMYLV